MTHWILHYNVDDDKVKAMILDGMHIKPEKQITHKAVGIFYEGKYTARGMDSDLYRHGDKVYEASKLEDFCRKKNSHPHDFEGNRLTNHADIFSRERDNLRIFKLKHDDVPDIIKDNYQRYLVVKEDKEKK